MWYICGTRIYTLMKCRWTNLLLYKRKSSFINCSFLSNWCLWSTELSFIIYDDKKILWYTCGIFTNFYNFFNKFIKKHWHIVRYVVYSYHERRDKMLKNFYEYFGLDELIKFEKFKKLAFFIAVEYIVFAIVMLAW